MVRRDKRSHVERKLRQLCRQVERRLSLALDELGDPLLEDVFIESVEPATGGAFRVVVSSLSVEAISRREEVLARLRSLRGRLRSEVAEEIYRKKTPHLTFGFATPQPSPFDEDLEIFSS